MSVRSLSVVVMLLAVGFFRLYSRPRPSCYYVANNGNDSWSGTLAAPNDRKTDGPFETIAKAQRVMRKSKLKVVRVRSGTYTLSFDLAFTVADRGQTWTAYSNEVPVLDGNRAHHIVMSTTTDLSLFGFKLRNMSRYSIAIKDAKNVMIRWNSFENPQTDAIYGSSINGGLVDSNTISGGTADVSPNPVMNFFRGTHNLTVSHNFFQNTQGSGISFNNGPKDPVMHDDVEDSNLFINVGQGGRDFGPLYIYDAGGSGYGNRITNNKVVIAGNGSINSNMKGIYLDDNTSGVEVSGNIIVYPGQYGLQYHGGKNNNVHNNIFDLSNAAQLGLYQSLAGADTGMGGNTFAHNVVYSSGEFAPSLWSVILNSGESLLSSHDNLYYSAKNASIPNTGIVDSHQIFANPQFTSPGVSAYDYSMATGSPAYTQVGVVALPKTWGPLPP